MSGANSNAKRPFAEGIVPAMNYFAFRGAALLAEKLPVQTGDNMARLLGLIWYRASKKRRRIVEANLSRVFGSGHDDRIKEAFVSYSQYWLETFRLGRYSRADLLNMVEPTPRTVETMNEALAEGRGVLLATGHIGFYDLGVAWIGSMGWPFTTVAEVLKPRALFEWFARIRRQRGMDVIPVGRGADIRAELARRLVAGHGVAILSDRDIRRRGVWANLFGERTTMPASPAILVVDKQVPLLGGAIYKTGPARFKVIFERIHYELTADRDRDITEVTQKIATSVERLVREHPEQWHLFSTNWPSDETDLPPRGLSS